jgi:hypothetical protein
MTSFPTLLVQDKRTEARAIQEAFYDELGTINIPSMPRSLLTA